MRVAKDVFLIVYSYWTSPVRRPQQDIHKSHRARDFLERHPKRWRVQRASIQDDCPNEASCTGAHRIGTCSSVDGPFRTAGSAHRAAETFCDASVACKLRSDCLFSATTFLNHAPGSKLSPSRIKASTYLRVSSEYCSIGMFVHQFLAL